MTHAQESDDLDDEALAEVLADMSDDEIDDLADTLGDPDEAERSMSRFDRLVAKLRAKGHSEESARRLAAHIGRKKYGRAGFAALAAKGRAKKKVAMRSQVPDYYSRVWALDDIEILRGGKGGDGRTVAAYAAVFGQRAEIRDQHGHYYEQIHRSAFNRAISHGIENRVTVLYNHGFDLSGNPSGLGSVPIGSPVEIKPDNKGLYTVTRYNRSELADAVLHAIENGDIRGYSFRGRVFQSDPPRVPRIQRSGELPTITRMELGLSEYGPTPIPFYADAGIVAIRSALLPDLRRLPERERIVIARALLDDEPDDPTPADLTGEPTDPTPEPEATEVETEAPDGADEAPATPDPDESGQDEPEQDPADAQPTPSDEGPGAEGPPVEAPLQAETARSISAADAEAMRRKARVALILRGGK